MEAQRKTPKVPLQQKAAQVRRETKQKIKSDVKQNNQKRLELKKKIPPTPLKQKNCESQTDRRTRKQKSDTKVAQTQRETKKFNGASPTKPPPATTVTTNNCGSPTGNPQSRNTTKNCSSPTRDKTKNQPLELIQQHIIFLCAAQANKKRRKPNTMPRKHSSIPTQ